MPLLATAALALAPATMQASSHREAPLISQDPLADNTDVYAFRSPDNPNTVTIIANYIPFEHPEGGPNWYSFGENIRYEIHVDNNAGTPGDEIIYRFTFTKTNEDPTTFFNIRLGKQNLKTTYMVEKSTNNGQSFAPILQSGIVPPPNIGPRSIEGAAGLNAPNYLSLMQGAVATATGGGGEKIFCGPVDDPFFVDLGAIFDLGAVRKKTDAGTEKTRDAVAGYNVHTIALQIPINVLQKDGKSVDQATSILDGDYVIGVWANASRPRITTLSDTGGAPSVSGEYVQVSRLGMPLTNEAIIPVGSKDKWNSFGPHDTNKELATAGFFVNPELALYMDDSKFGAAVPDFAPLRIQSKSLGSFDFRNGHDGLSGLTQQQREGTVFADPTFGPILLQAGAPRSVDLLPIFFTGVPNLRPYQLATGKAGNPLAGGKPFINNFLPSIGDMLRLNMAVPATPRNSADFSTLGLVGAAALGLTDPRFNTTADLQNIPNMDGFPNGRRLEDDVTTIELQAVSGVVLAAIGLWYDDYVPGQSPSPVTPNLLSVLTFKAGPEKNDTNLMASFPYMAEPHRGYDYVRRQNGNSDGTTGVVETGTMNLGLSAPAGFFVGQSYPNPAIGSATIRFHLGAVGPVTLKIYDVSGRELNTLVNRRMEMGDYTITWAPDAAVPAGTYLAELRVNGSAVATQKISVSR